MPGQRFNPNNSNKDSDPPCYVSVVWESQPDAHGNIATLTVREDGCRDVHYSVITTGAVTQLQVIVRRGSPVELHRAVIQFVKANVADIIRGVVKR